MASVEKLIINATTELSSYSQSPRLDCEVLLMHILQCSRAWLYAHSDYSLTPTEQQSFMLIFHQRKAGIPIAYLIGYKDFWSMRLKVNAHTLIPRPETELLVEITLEMLEKKCRVHVLELGTGSGAISLALAKERPIWDITAIDISKDALEIAKENAQQLCINSVNFAQSNWFDAIDKKPKVRCNY